MSNTKTKMFNIDIESRRHYPKGTVLIPALQGLSKYVVTKVHSTSMTSGRHFMETTVRRAS